MEKVYKRRLNVAITYFEIFYVGYVIFMILEKQYQDALVVAISGAIIFVVLLGLRAHKYSIDRKTLIIHRRIGKNREVNLMTVETISDPIPKLTKFVTDPHCLELYLEGKKRVVVAPKEKMRFIQDVLLANKRMHVEVEDYKKNHKSLRREQKKMRKKALKKGEIENN